MTEINADVDFILMAENVAITKNAVLGEGGLCQRVKALEDAQKSSYRITGIFGGFGVVVGSAITFLIQIFKG